MSQRVRTANPILLDVDPGVDDALALLYAAGSPRLDLLAVTCVAGNAPLDDVVRNTLLVLESAGRAEIPVAAGARRPLLEAPNDARHVHGADGMADLGWPAPARAPDPRPAVELLRDVVDAAAAEGRPATLVTLGPMTNAALFARTFPDSFARLRALVFMGGGAQVSNATAAAEFNVFHDPEAAAMVLDAGVEHQVPVTMYGLDVFYDPVVTREQAAQLACLGSDFGPGRLAAGLLDFLCRRFDSAAATIGDAGAVVTLAHPELLSASPLPVRVELAGTWTRGRTIVDLRDWSGDLDHDPHGLAPAEVHVARQIDAAGVAAAWLETIRRASTTERG